MCREMTTLPALKNLDIYVIYTFAIKEYIYTLKWQKIAVELAY